MIYAGLDLHKSFSVITAMNAQGKETVKQENIDNNGEIVEFLEGLGEPVTVAMEATCSWYWLYDLVDTHGQSPWHSDGRELRSTPDGRIRIPPRAKPVEPCPSG